MAAAGEVEAYLRRLDRTFEKIGEDTFVVGLGAGQPPAVLKLSPPVLVAQVDVAEAPSKNPALEAKLAANPRVVRFAGGVPLKAGDTIVGFIAASGASAAQDEACAKAGAEKIAARIK